MTFPETIRIIFNVLSTNMIKPLLRLQLPSQKQANIPTMIFSVPKVQVWVQTHAVTTSAMELWKDNFCKSIPAPGFPERRRATNKHPMSNSVPQTTGPSNTFEDTNPVQMHLCSFHLPRHVRSCSSFLPDLIQQWNDDVVRGTLNFSFNSNPTSPLLYLMDALSFIPKPQTPAPAHRKIHAGGIHVFPFYLAFDKILLRIVSSPGSMLHRKRCAIL